MSKKIIYGLVGAAVVFFIISLIIFLQSDSSAEKAKPAEAQSKSVEKVEEPEFINLKVFFYTERSRYMRPVLYELEFPPIREDLYLKFMDLLLKGEENYINPIPEGVTLRSLYYIEDENLLVLDFNEELIIKFPAGTGTELEFIYFFVDNFCYNFKEIKKVMFSVAGNNIKTLTGHIDMENPFYPNYGYLIDQ
jgi:spore germination protein GerM